jgi:gamma-D-glutamyl-L-lysine dipeptidyl-peptidase
MNLQPLIQVSVAPMRHEPSDRAEQVSQLLYGELIEVLEKQEKWSLIKSLADGYEGWIDNKQWGSYDLSKRQKKRVLVRQSCLANATDLLWVPHGSLVWVDEAGHSFDDRRVEWADLGEVLPLSPTSLLEAADVYVNTPYLWGGRSVWGIDCSGFMQQLFAMHGLELPRDAYQQAALGETIHLIGEAQAGDLLFFDNDEGRIIHVGLYTGQGQVVHASGNVRRDRVDHFGIFNAQENRYTHSLRLIKRLP